MQKKCTKCGEVKPLSEYHRNRHARDGHNYSCKECVRAADAKRWAKKAAARQELFFSDTHMQCSGCGEVKPFDDFYHFRGVPNGKRCKQCRREYEQKRRWTPERLAAKSEFRLKGIEDTVCNYLTCDEMQSHGGLCSRHYRERCRGVLNEDFVLRFVTLCGAPGCDLAIPDKRWLCKGHASQLRRFGETWPLGCCRDCHSPLPVDAGKGRIYCNDCGPHRARNHGKSRQWFEETLAQQGYACAICGSTDPAGKYDGWHIDHDHRCCPSGTSCGGCVRGILCYLCNSGLGFFGDDPDRLAGAASYLQTHKTGNESVA